jgi:hypothetical protein
MRANERATRSLRLKVSAYSSKEKAVMAIPAVRSSLMVRKVEIIASYIRVPVIIVKRETLI